MNKLDQEYNLSSDLHIQLQHLHKGNSTKKQRSGASYKTLVNIVDRKNHILATATATCSREDLPNRKRGRDIAIGRALKQLA